MLYLRFYINKLYTRLSTYQVWTYIATFSTNSTLGMFITRIHIQKILAGSDCLVPTITREIIWNIYLISSNSIFTKDNSYTHTFLHFK